MKPPLHPSSILLLAAVALALAACGGGGDDGSGPSIGTSPVACQAAPEKCA